MKEFHAARISDVAYPWRLRELRRTEKGKVVDLLEYNKKSNLN